MGPNWRRKIVALGAAGVGFVLVIAALAPTWLGMADARMMMDRDFRHIAASFQFLDAPLKTRVVRDAKNHAVSLSGTTIAPISGDRFAVLDGDRGELVITDALGRELQSLAIAADASLLAVDETRNVIFVADRRGDRIWKVAVNADSKLKVLMRARSPAEPFGLALTPDGETLLVTTVADRTLVAYETETMKKSWSEPLAPEPRGVAISPNGKEAIVTHLTTGTVTNVDLVKRVVSHTALNRTSGLEATIGFEVAVAADPDAAPPPRIPLRSPRANSSRVNHQQRTVARRGGASSGEQFARNAFAALYLPTGVAAVAYQESTPQQAIAGQERVGTYGGGADAPINHRIAFVGVGSEGAARPIARAEIALHQPRALAYDASRDMLYVAAIGNDQVLAIANASTPAALHAWSIALPLAGAIRCGPNGVAVGADGQVRVFCSFSRRVATIVETDHPTSPTRLVALGDELTRSRLSNAELIGKQVFHQGSDFRLSMQGAMACSSCHPEGRTDGLSWRIEGHSLQTPLLTGGRLEGTHPFKWDGKDKDLKTSLTNTVIRLGGSGIDASTVAGLTAFFATLERPRSPTADSKAIARGEKLFRGKTLGCNRCHSGPRLTNGQSYPLSNELGEVDTPSLIGLAASAPYYHDGSAADLGALLRDKGDIHDMGGIDRVKPSQVGDLIAFLNSL